MHVTNCCFLLSKAGFCFDILLIFYDFSFFFFLFHEHVTNGFSVKLSFVRCVDTFHSLTSVLYLVRLVFHAKHGGGGLGRGGLS